MIETRSVRTRKEFKEFVRFGAAMAKLRSHPIYLPTGLALKDLIPKYNPALQAAQVEHFLAYDANGKTVGRISAIVDQDFNKFQNQTTAFFGNLDVIDDPAALAALLRAVGYVADQHGLTTIAGPYTYASSQFAGLLIDGFETPPSAMQTDNARYYGRLLEEAGFRLRGRFTTYRSNNVSWAPSPEQLADMRAKSDAICRRKRMTVRSLNMRSFNSECDLICDLLNRIFVNQIDFSPIPADVFKYQLTQFKPFLDPDFIRIFERDGSAIGVFLNLPDLNVLLRGHSDIRKYAKIGLASFGLKRIDEVIMAVAGFVPGYPRTGVGSLIITEAVRLFAEKRVRQATTMWIDETNSDSRRLADAQGMVPDKTFAVYEIDTAVLVA